MQQPPPGQGWPRQQWIRPATNRLWTTFTITGPPQQGQWNQGPYTPYATQQGISTIPNTATGQWQQPIAPNPQWSQQPYGQPPPQQPKKKSKLLIIIGVTVSLLVLSCLCIGACALVSSWTYSKCFCNQTKSSYVRHIATQHPWRLVYSPSSNSNSTSSSSSSHFTSSSTTAPVVW